MSEPIPKQELKTILNEISMTTGHGAVFFSADGDGMLCGDKICGFCRFCLRHPVLVNYCRYACSGGAMQSMTSGEPHFQRCWAGLLYVAVAIAPGGVYKGALAMGGFYSGDTIPVTGETLAESMKSVSAADQAKLFSLRKSLHSIDSGALRGMGLFLLEMTISSGLNSAAVFNKRHEEYVRQREIAAAYMDLKQTRISTPDVFADTYRLASYLHQHDRQSALRFISEYLAKLLLISNWNLTRLRAFVRVLLAVITSQDVLDGMDWSGAVRREWMYMSRIEKADNTEDICTAVAELVMEHFSGDSAIDSGRKLSDRVTEWLERNCGERATLQDATKAVGASVSAISHILPQETGKTYSALRRGIRIARAKRLLATSAMDISAIADACGFTDQSHFTRVFKQEVNLTPGMFRKMLKLV